MRGNISDVELAGRLAAVTLGIEVVMNRHVRGGAGSSRVDSNAGDEVIDGAGDRIDRNAGDLRPVNTVGGAAENQIVGRALGAEAAILPHNVDVACAVRSEERRVG